MTTMTNRPPLLWLLRLYRRHHEIRLKHGRRHPRVKLLDVFWDAMAAVVYGVRPPDPAAGIEAACCPPAASGRLREAARRRRKARGGEEPVARLYDGIADYVWRQEGSRKSLGQLPKRQPFG